MRLHRSLALFAFTLQFCHANVVCPSMQDACFNCLNQEDGFDKSSSVDCSQCWLDCSAAAGYSIETEPDWFCKLCECAGSEPSKCEPHCGSIATSHFNGGYAATDSGDTSTADMDYAGIFVAGLAVSYTDVDDCGGLHEQYPCNGPEECSGCEKYNDCNDSEQQSNTFNHCTSRSTMSLDKRHDATDAPSTVVADLLLPSDHERRQDEAPASDATVVVEILSIVNRSPPSPNLRRRQDTEVVVVETIIVTANTTTMTEQSTSTSTPPSPSKPVVVVFETTEVTVTTTTTEDSDVESSTEPSKPLNVAIATKLFDWKTSASPTSSMNISMWLDRNAMLMSVREPQCLHQEASRDYYGHDLRSLCLMDACLDYACLGSLAETKGVSSYFRNNKSFEVTAPVCNGTWSALPLSLKDDTLMHCNDTFSCIERCAMHAKKATMSPKSLWLLGAMAVGSLLSIFLTLLGLALCARKMFKRRRAHRQSLEHQPVMNYQSKPRPNMTPFQRTQTEPGQEHVVNTADGGPATIVPVTRTTSTPTTV